MDPTDGRTGGPRERWLVGLLLVAALGAIGTWMTWASFSVTAANEGNLVATGTVAIGNDAHAQPIYDVTDGSPATTVDRCVEVSYTGDIPATVRLYATPIDDGDHVSLELWHGTGSTFPDCDGFEPADGDPLLFDGTLAGFAAEHSSWESGLLVPGPARDIWTNDEGSVGFRFRLEQLESGGYFATGAHSYVWEARS